MWANPPAETTRRPQRLARWVHAERACLARPGELVGVDCFSVGRLSGTKGAVWQLTAIDVASSFAWAELVSCPKGNPTGLQTSKLARRVAAALQAAGWRFERLLTDNGGELRWSDFRSTLEQLGIRHTLIRAGRPQNNGAVEALHRLILEECWRPAFARYLHLRFTCLKRDLALHRRLQLPARPQRPTHPRPHPRRHRLRCQQGEDEMSRHCPHISESV
ncbi:MAG TPA: DDE-type integrase/transposase/recombinase [Gaiellaceae bacterium]